MPVGYMELWNEPDKTYMWYPNADLSLPDRPRVGFTAPEYAALASATFDGHDNTVRGDRPTPGAINDYQLGVLQFPNVKFVMAGLSDIDPANITYLYDFRTQYNNVRGTPTQFNFPFRVINYHHYCDNKWDGLGTVGVSPESDNFNIGGTNTKFKQRLIDLRTQFTTGANPIGANCEFWLSEFGWDTNSGSDQKAPAIGSNDQEEVQGEWLVRGYMEIAAAGWNRAMQFCIRDENSASGGGRFQASGLLRDRYQNHVPKKSYYYVSTMKNALTGTKFQQEFSTNAYSSGNTAADVRIMRFVRNNVASPSGANNGDYILALWLPSSAAATLNTAFNLTTALGLPANTAQALLVKMDPRDMNGVRTALTVTNGGGANPTITIPAYTITERPIYIIIGSTAVDAAPPALSVSAQALSCNSVRLSWTAPINTYQSYRVYYYEKNDSEEGGANPVFNSSDANWKMYVWNHPAQTLINGTNTVVNSMVVTGLGKMEDEYHFYVEGVTPAGVLAKTTLYDVKTLQCAGNNVINGGFIFTPSSAATAGANAFSLEKVEQCYPQNKAIDYAAGALMPADVTVNLNGAKLEVPDGISATFNTTEFRGCDYLWDAISVTGNALVSFDAAVVRDARNALRLNETASALPRFSVFNTRVERCFRGLTTTSTQTTPTVVLSPRLVDGGSFFDGTDDDLKKHWSTTLDAPVFNKRAYLAANFDRVNQLSWGWNMLPTPPVNVIKNFTFGLVGYNSVINMANTRFENIQPTLAQTAGQAIQTTNCSVTLYGLTGSSKPLTFQNVSTAALIQSSDFLAKDCRTAGMTNGLIATSCKPKAAPGNQATNWVVAATGVGMSVTSNNIGVQLDNNNITVSGNGDGISAAGASGTPANIFNIHHNTVTLNNTTANNAAIRVQATSGAKVEDNPNIYLNFYPVLPTNFGYGIYAAAAPGISIKRNKVDGNPYLLYTAGWDWFANAANRFGIFVNNSNGWAIDCNNLNETKYGLVFDGSNTGATNGLYNNLLRGHSVGLELRNSAQIGTQTDRWTKWGRPVADYLGGAAKHWSNSSNDWNLSQIKVPSGASPYSPQGNVVPSAANGTWILPNSTATPPAACAPASQGDPEVDDRNDEYDQKIKELLADGGLYQQWVSGAIDPNSLTKIGRWELKKAIYRALVSTAGESVLAQPGYAAFVALHQNGPIGRLVSVQKGIQTDLAWPDGLRQQRELLSKAQTTVVGQVAKNNELLLAVPVEARLQYVQSHAALLQLPDQWTAMQALDAQVLTDWTTAAGALRLLNQSVPEENEYATLEKQANDIFLKTVAVNQYVFSPEQEIALRAIAERCPAKYGEGVIRARVLYAYIDPTSTARWSDECIVNAQEEGEEIEERAAPTTVTKISLQVAPNPVAGDLWYETNAPIGTPWLLSSSLGKVMQSGNTTSSYWTRLGLGTLPPGVYILTIQGQQGPVSKRIVKQ